MSRHDNGAKQKNLTILYYFVKYGTQKRDKKLKKHVFYRKNIKKTSYYLKLAILLHCFNKQLIVSH